MRRGGVRRETMRVARKTAEAAASAGSRLRMRILLVEDHTHIAVNVYDYLAARGHHVDAASDGASGLHLALTQPFDGILLDLALPRLGGLTVCRKLREARVDTPILILTARDTVDDKLQGFELGADDYLVKPFSLQEVEARLLALHKRRSGYFADRVLQLDGLELDLRAFTVRCNGVPLKLARKCIQLLEFFMKHPDCLHSRAELEIAIWGEPQDTSETLRTHMHVLRRAIVRAGCSDPFENVHGAGYRLLKKTVSA